MTLNSRMTVTTAVACVLEEVGFEDVEARYGLPAVSIASERVALASRPG